MSTSPVTLQRRKFLAPIYASAVGAAGGAMTVSLGGAAGLFTYLTRLTISCPNVASVVNGQITLTGVPVTLNWQYVETVSAGGMINEEYDPAIIASDVNTAIVLNVPVIAGGGAIAVNMYGYQANY